MAVAFQIAPTPCGPVETLLAPQLEKERKHRRNWLVVAIVLAVLVVVGAIEFKPLHAWVQGVRARRLATKAEAEMRAGNWQEATFKSRDAYQIKPDEPVALRMVARVQGRTGHFAGAATLWKQLVALGAATPADRQEYAETLLLSGRVPEAGIEIQKLLRERPEDTVLLRLATRWAASEGDSAAARDFAAKAVRLDPANGEGRLMLGVLQLTSGVDALRTTGIQSLMELGREPTKAGIEALRQLGTQPGLPAETRETIAGLLKKHPEATIDHRLLAMEIEIALHPANRAALIDAAIGQYKNAEPAVKRTFGVWLRLQGESERLLTFLPVEEGFKRKDLLLVCLDALAALKRWTEIERVLEIRDVPLDDSYREVFLAISAKELGSPMASEMHWRSAHIAAGPSPEQMGYVGSYAEKVGELDQAELAFRSLTANAKTARPAWEALWRIAERKRDPEMLREILGAMHKRWPKDSAVSNDYAYVNLLQGREIEESFDTARRLVEQSPGSTAHRTTFALAAFRKKDPAAALSMYQGLQFPWDRGAAGQRAVYAAVLGLNGKTAEARAEASAIRWDDLRTEERELIKQWRTP